MNIVKELHKVAARNAQAEIDESQSVLNSINLHLEAEAEKDNEMLQHFGVSKLAQQHQEKVSFNEKRLVGAVLSIGDIQSICLKYALRFLPAKQYIKGIPAKALNDLRNFSKANKIESLEYSEYDDKGLYMIAPVSHFKLGPRPKRDPVLIWRDGDNYSVVSQWGDDFSWTRRVFGWFKNELSSQLLLSYIVVAIFAIGYYGYVSFARGGDDVLYALLAVVFGFLLTFIISISIDGTGNWDKKTK